MVYFSIIQCVQFMTHISWQFMSHIFVSVFPLISQSYCYNHCWNKEKCTAEQLSETCCFLCIPSWSHNDEFPTSLHGFSIGWSSIFPSIHLPSCSTLIHLIHGHSDPKVTSLVGSTLMCWMIAASERGWQYLCKCTPVALLWWITPDFLVWSYSTTTNPSIHSPVESGHGTATKAQNAGVLLP